MNKVITVNLNGRAYQVEEGAYDALRRWLDQADARLGDNPDKAEIISDLEQAIAEKCDLYRTQHKLVITAADMGAVLAAMGPVDGDDAASTSTEKAAPAPKRLYRLEEGKVLFGVCAGLAAYLDLDVTLVRVLYVILTILTHGFGILVYILMIFIVPRAHTPAQKAQAFGATAMTANELISRAKESYKNFRNSPEWKQGSEEWKQGTAELQKQMKQWRKEWKSQRHHQQRLAHMYARDRRPSPFWEAVQSILGMVWFLLIIYLGWLLYTYVPVAHDLMNQAGMVIAQAFRALLDLISSNLPA